MAPPASSLLNARVVAALCLQVAGYAALLALFPHGSPSGVVDAVARAPPVVSIPLAIPAILPEVVCGPARRTANVRRDVLVAGRGYAPGDR